MTFFKIEVDLQYEKGSVRKKYFSIEYTVLAHSTVN